MPMGSLSRQQIKGLPKPMGSAIRMPIPEALGSNITTKSTKGTKNNEKDLSKSFLIFVPFMVYSYLFSLLQFEQP